MFNSTKSLLSWQYFSIVSHCKLSFIKVVFEISFIILFEKMCDVMRDHYHHNSFELFCWHVCVRQVFLNDFHAFLPSNSSLLTFHSAQSLFIISLCISQGCSPPKFPPISNFRISRTFSNFLVSKFRGQTRTF